MFGSDLPYYLTLCFKKLGFVGSLFEPHQPVQLDPYPFSRAGHETKDWTDGVTRSVHLGREGRRERGREGRREGGREGGTEEEMEKWSTQILR